MMKSSLLMMLGLLALCGCPTADNKPATGQTSANTPDNAASNEPKTPNDGSDSAKPDPVIKDDTPAAQTPIEQRNAEFVAFEGGLRAYPERKVVELDAALLSEQTRPLEYLLVMPGGNTHESLFATAARGVHLKRALEIIGLEEGTEKRTGRGYIDAPQGSPVRISVRFRHSETGEETTVGVEQWLWNHQANANPPAEGWVFIGSFEQYRPELNRSLFEADMKGNLIGMWRDAATVIDNGRKDAYIPDIYSPYPEADGIPKVRGGVSPEVTLIFEPMKD